MGLTSLQVCMDSSDDWFQEEAGMGSSTPSEDILTCSRPLIEKRLRPQDEKGVNCPRCDSTHTKFCYYNNYSLSQPRYFCKTCRRYWTKGGTLRNIPIGGGCRKNKKAAIKASNVDQSSNSRSSNDLHLHNILGSHTNFMVENPRPIDFMESKVEGIGGSFSNYEFMGVNGGELGMIDMSHGLVAPSFNPYGMMSLDDGNVNPFMDTPFIDMKPHAKLLPLDCHDQGCSYAGKDTYRFLINNLESWNGMMNNNGPSATNQFL